MESSLEKMGVCLAIVIFAIRYIYSKNKLPLALYIYIVLVPYNGVLNNYFPLLDKVVNLLLVIAGVKCIINNKFIVYMDGHFLFYIFSIFMSVFILTLQTLDLQILFGNSEFRFMIGMYLLSIIIFQSVNCRQQCYQIFNIFSINAFLIAIGGIVTYGINGFTMGGTRLKYILGINHYAIFLFIGLLIIFNFVLINNKKLYFIEHIKAMIFICVIGTACLWTKSVAIYIAGMFILLLFFIYKTKKENYGLWKWCFKVLGFFSIFIMVTAILENDGMFLKHFLKLLGRGLDLSRLKIWNMAFSEFLKHPLFGIGAGIFRANVDGINYISHNDFWKILTETGIIGMVAFGMYLYDVLHSCFLLNSEKETLFALSVCASMLIFMMTHNYTIYAVFWIITFTIKRMSQLDLGYGSGRNPAIIINEGEYE